MAGWHLDTYERWLAAEFSASTADVYARAVRQFADWVHHTNKNIVIIDITDVETFLLHLQNNASVETEHVYSRALLRYVEFLANTESLPIDNHAIEEAITQLRRPKQHNLPDLPLDVIEKIHAFAINWSPQPDPGSARTTYRNLRDRAFVLVLAETGLRVGGVVSLRESNFNPGESMLLPVGGEAVTLTIQTTQALSRYLNARSRDYKSTPQSILFARHDKRASNSLLSILRWTASNIIDHVMSMALSPKERREIAEKGISITPHSFRHYFVAVTLTRLYPFGRHSRKVSYDEHKTSVRSRDRPGFTLELPAAAGDDNVSVQNATIGNINTNRGTRINRMGSVV